MGEGAQCMQCMYGYHGRGLTICRIHVASADFTLMTHSITVILSTLNAQGKYIVPYIMLHVNTFSGCYR